MHYSFKTSVDFVIVVLNPSELRPSMILSQERKQAIQGRNSKSNPATTIGSYINPHSTRK